MKKLLILYFLALAMASCSTDDPEPVQNDPVPGIPSPDPQEPQPEIPDVPDEPVVKAPEYQVARLRIDTDGAVPVVSKEEYVKCTVTVDSDFDDWDFTASAGVRGRGNSSWLWYDKKPYRIKLDKKASIMGMGEGKSWVLLANYRDPTDLMNTFVFELGALAGMPFTNHTRYVRLALNGQDMGLYQLTEQVRQGKGRVNVDGAQGYLLSFDVDDGPAESPGAGDNFWSEVYRMPVCVKNPEDLTREGLDAVKADLAQLETAIRRGDYEQVKSLMDVGSLIDFVMIQELVYNVELDAPRSMYIHKDVGGRWTMGPLWDFDAGYDFDWSSMYTGHNFFNDYRETVLGTDPARHKGTGYEVPGFFSDLFKVEAFVADYKTRWKQMSHLVPQAWERTLSYIDDEQWAAEQKLWPIGKDYRSQVEAMDRWISNRTVYLTNIINNYPSH